MTTSLGRELERLWYTLLFYFLLKWSLLQPFCPLCKAYGLVDYKVRGQWKLVCSYRHDQFLMVCSVLFRRKKNCKKGQSMFYGGNWFKGVTPLLLFKRGLNDFHPPPPQTIILVEHNFGQEAVFKWTSRMHPLLTAALFYVVCQSSPVMMIMIMLAAATNVCILCRVTFDLDIGCLHIAWMIIWLGRSEVFLQELEEGYYYQCFNSS